MPRNVKFVRFPILGNYGVRIEIAKDLAKAIKRARLETIEVGEFTDAMACYREKQATTFIFIKPNASNGTIAHEAYHAVCHLMKYTGVDLENEVVAYHLGYLVNKISRMWRRKQ